MLESFSKIAVIGLGLSSKSFIDYLKSENVSANLTVFLPALNEQQEDFLKSRNSKFVVNEQENFNLSEFDLIFLSPGVPIAKYAPSDYPGAKFIGTDFPLAWQKLTEKKLIMVTGTNGKSTVLTLIDHLMAANHLLIETGGNLGNKAVFDLLTSKSEWLALELSSYQLAGLGRVKAICDQNRSAEVLVITNLSEDHISWHGDLDSYHSAKLSIINPDHSDYLGLKYLIVSASDLTRINSLIGETPESLKVIELPEEGSYNKWVDFRDSTKLRIYFENEELTLDLPESGFFSYSHNKANLISAVFCLLIRGVKAADINFDLSSYSSLSYRMEELGRVEGILWINDSKSTTIASTLAAANSLKSEFVLVVGGVYKGDRAADGLPDYCRKVFSYGDGGKKICKELGAESDYVEDFKGAVKAAFSFCKEKSFENLLISPAGASFDQFENFNQRGMAINNIFESFRAGEAS